MQAKEALAQIYEAVIGYDPFKDDPATDPDACVEVMREALTEYPEKKAVLGPAVWVFERIDFDGPLEFENLEIVREALAALAQED